MNQANDEEFDETEIQDWTLRFRSPFLISKPKKSESVRSRQRKKPPIWHQTDGVTTFGDGKNGNSKRVATAR